MMYAGKSRAIDARARAEKQNVFPPLMEPNIPAKKLVMIAANVSKILE